MHNDFWPDERQRMLLQQVMWSGGMKIADAAAAATTGDLPAAVGTAAVATSAVATTRDLAPLP